MVSIGIDVGISGGIAVISDKIKEVYQIPIFEGTKGGSKSKIDIRATSALIVDSLKRHALKCSVLWTGDDVVATMEALHAMPGQGVTSMFHFGESYGMLQAMCTLNNWKLQLVTPQAWKKDILAGTPKDKTAAIQHCRASYPDLDINVGKKKTIYHDGMADAICIAEYGAKIARV